jgi:hypothetical protein
LPLRLVRWDSVKAIDEQDIGSARQLLDGSLHRQDGSLSNVDPIDGVGIDIADSNSYGRAQDLVVESFACLGA